MQFLTSEKNAGRYPGGKENKRVVKYLKKEFTQKYCRGKTVYPGLDSHPSHELYKTMMNADYGFGGMLTIDVGSLDNANALMELMQEQNIGYLAVSLGFYKTLFSAPGTSTSSEISEKEQLVMGLSDGLIRFSIGLDDDIQRTYINIKKCMIEMGIL